MKKCKWEKAIAKEQKGNSKKVVKVFKKVDHYDY